METQGPGHISRSVTRPPSNVESASSNVTSITRHNIDTYEDTDDSTPKPPNYRPWVMNSWSIGFWIILPLISIGLIEYVHRTSLRDRGLFRKGPKYETRELVSEFVPDFMFYFILIFSGLFFFDLDIAVKKMEPFYHMSKPEGATGLTSLCVDYFRPPIILIPYIAIKNRHWTVLCTSLALIIDTIVLLQLVSRSFRYNEEYKMRMVPVYKWALQGVLGVASLLMLILAIILHRRNSGVLHNPKGFESLIRFTKRPDLKNSIYAVFETLRIDAEISEVELEKKLGSLRFKLQVQNLDTEEPQFDILLNENDLPLPKKNNTQSISSETTSSSWTKTPRRLLSKATKTPRRWLSKATKTPRRWLSKATKLRRRWLWKDNHPWLFQKIPLSVFLFIHIGLFIVLTGQPFWARNTGFPRRFGWWDNVLKAIFSILNATFWMQIRRYSVEYEHIYLMNREQGAPYDKLGPSYMSWPVQDLYHAFRNIYRNGYGDSSSYVDLATSSCIYASCFFLAAWLSLPDDTYDSWTTTIVCVSIMIPSEVIMVLTILLIFRSRSHPFLPRQPITLASKLMLVYATNIIKADFGSSVSRPLSQNEQVPGVAVVTESSQITGAASPQSPQSSQNTLSPSANGDRIIQQINPAPINTLATPSIGLATPTTSLESENDSSPKPRRWWDILRRKEKKKKKRGRVWLDFVEKEDPCICAFGNFTSHDGKARVGIGRHGKGMTTYTLSKEQQKRIDEEITCAYESRPVEMVDMA